MKPVSKQSLSGLMMRESKMRKGWVALCGLVFGLTLVILSEGLGQTQSTENPEINPAPLDSGTVLNGVGQSVNSDSNLSSNAVMNAVSNAEVEEDFDDEDENVGSDFGRGIEFLLPMDGDVFHTPDLSILATVSGLEPAGMVLVLDGYNLDVPIEFENGLLRAQIFSIHNGVHSLKVILLDASGRMLARREIRFFIRAPEPKRAESKGMVKQFGRVGARLEIKGAEARGRIKSQRELELQNGIPVAGKKEVPMAQQLDGALEGAYNLKVKDWETFAKVLLRTDENRFRQPSHRFSTRIKYGPYGYLKAGDVYPAFGELMLTGTRLRGGEIGGAIVINDMPWASLKVARGQTQRHIPAYEATYDLGLGDGSSRSDTLSGTPAQTLTAIRLGFGGGQSFDLGFSGLIAREEVLEGEERALNDSLRGPKPLHNAVLGSDLRIGLWKGQIQLFADWALSLVTSDRSLGAINKDTFDLSFDPKDFESVIPMNLTTRGLEYFIETPQHTADYSGFISSNTAWDAGISASIPLGSVISETEFRYDHLGLLFQSEGNPFLGSDPGDGFRFIQKILLFEHRLSLGVEASASEQEWGLAKQNQRGVKGEIRWTSLPTEPSAWLTVSNHQRVPQGDYPYQFKSGFLSFSGGAYQQFFTGLGRLHASALYALTESSFELVTQPLLDTSLAGSNSDYPDVQTHIMNTSLQLRPRNIDFMPRLAYTFATNGVQKPTHTVNMGFQQWLNDGRFKGDFGFQVGQYPESETKNDVFFGQNFGLDVRLTQTQTFRLREKWLQYGNRRNVSLGGFYELFF